MDRLPTPQGQSIAAIAQETLDEAESLTEAFGFKAVGFVALPGGSWGNNFSVFQRSGFGDQDRPSAYIAAVQEARAADLTPLTEEAIHPPEPPIANLTRAASPTTDLSAGVADEAAPTPQISTNLTLQVDMAPLPPSIGAAAQDAPGPQVADTKAMPPAISPAASAKSQVSQLVRMAQRLAGIRTLLSQSLPKPTEAQVGGKPKYLSLILTTLLLLFMFTVAALAATLGRDKIYAWLGYSSSQVEMTAGLPADPFGQAIEIR